MSLSPPGLLARSQDFDFLWHLTSQIGDGGQGEIYQTYPTKQNLSYYDHYQCSDYKNDSKYVTKIIHFEHENRRTREKIVRCYRFLQKYKLPLNIYGIYHDPLNKRVLIVMDKLHHELHEDFLNFDTSPSFNTRFARPGHIYLNVESSIKAFIKQIAKQLLIIHSHHRIHFDLKPENVMFNATENKWCIIDYDLMKDIDEENKKKYKYHPYMDHDKVSSSEADSDDGDVVGDDGAVYMELDHYRGTQSWTAPEISTRASKDKPCKVSSKADIFSFGLVILWMIHGGWQPYLLEEDDVKHVFCKELIEKPSWRRNKVYFDKLLRGGTGNKYLQTHIAELKDEYCISNGLCVLLQKMLCFDVAKRLSAQQILNHEWLNNIS